MNKITTSKVDIICWWSNNCCYNTYKNISEKIMEYLKPKDVLKKSYLKQKIEKEVFSHFGEALNRLKNSINKDESEEYNKNLITNFFKEIGYSKEYRINTAGRVDLAIYKDETPQVLIETKSLKNKSEMIDINNLNKKAFLESILYYLRETNKEKNYNIRHIIITNGIEWFIFDAVEIEKIASIKEIKKIYFDFEIYKTSAKRKTEDFYSFLKDYFSEHKNFLNKIKFVYFSLNNHFSKRELQNIYKLLSPTHLLKNYYENDANSLNKNFYYELLHILGLEEVKESGKKLIIRKKDRNGGSLIENTILKLQTEFNIEDEEKLFDIALELNITWLNRVLFLKLFEAKLIKIHDGNYPKFLNYEVTNDFDKLNTLFFEVLAKKIDDRKSIKIKEYKNIPYLNSSLFEPTELEKKYLRISNLKDNITLKKYSKTILKQEKDELNTLEYLLKFLDAYDFGSDEKDEFKDKNRPLINSAVLGLIFEKLNGYKDGSFFTPSFITMHMAKEVIKKAVINKFNKTFGWNCKTLIDIYNKDYDLQKANEIINSITICDPAVGSGHFLVSVLNELLAVKSELGILCDEKGKRLKNVKLVVEDDEIYILDEDGEVFEYKLKDGYKISDEKLRVQKTIFREKLHIIENQLFGVDINPNSVKIARLRLWIELLKDSYYDEKRELVTLPNIDINIKCGNSLISRFSLNDKETKSTLLKERIDDYKKYVKWYKDTNDKSIKREVFKKIEEIKNSFSQKLKSNSPLIKEIKVLLNGDKNKKGYIEQFGFKGLDEDIIINFARQDYCILYARFGKDFDINSKSLFGNDIKLTQKEKREFEKRQKRELEKIIAKYERIKDFENSKIYKNAFEWRFEFPEVLNEDGEFEGFDVIIGNPPYIMEDDNKEAFEGLHQEKCYQGKTDIWHLFTCKAISLVKDGGLISFIAKNQWLSSASASKMRKKLYQETEIEKIVDFGVNLIFEDVGQQTMIFLLSKIKSNKEHKIEYIKFNKKLSKKEIADILLNSKDSKSISKITKTIPKYFDESENLTFSTNEKEKILEKIEKKRNFEFDSKKEIIQGIIGGPDKAFIISGDELKNFSESEKEFIKMIHTNTKRFYTPPTNQYIFYISKKNFEGRNIEDYPNIKNRLLKYYNKLKNRREVLNGKIEWFYLWWPRDEKFFKEGEKIVWAKRTIGKNFTFTKEPFYGTANLFFIKSDRVNLRYITALLNSKLLYFYMSERLKHTGGLLQIDKNQFMKIPLYVIDEVEEFEKLVDKICEFKKENKDTKELEEEIDKMVYDLYGLSQKEIEIVEKELS